MSPPVPSRIGQARHVGASLEHAVPGDGDAGAAALGRRPARIGGADAERALLDEDVPQHSLVLREHTLDDGGVAPLGVARGELSLEPGLRLGRLRDDQEPRGLTVEAVDDEGPARRPGRP